MKFRYVVYFFFFGIIFYKISFYLIIWASTLEEKGQFKTARLITWLLVYPLWVLGLPGLFTLGALDHAEVQRLYRRHIADLRKVRELARVEYSQNEYAKRRVAAAYDAPRRDDPDFDFDFWLRSEYDRLGL